MFFLVPTGRGTLLEPLTATEVEEVLHWLYEISTLVAIKTTEAPHFRRIAMQRMGVAALDDAFPVGPLAEDPAACISRRPQGHQPR